jgi:hypothetical protein
VVVERMPHHHAVGTDGPGDFSEESIAHLTGRLLKRSTSVGVVTPYIALLDCRRDIKTADQTSHIAGIVPRLIATKLVVKVGHMEFHPQFRLQLYQYMKEAN